MLRLSLVCVLLFALPVFAAEKRPNVVVILADDQGWGDLSVHGNTNLRTPHIDSLARDGARFDRFFVQPVCSPTRAEFLTGRYHSRGGVWNVSTGGERLNLNEKTIANFFREAGYATGCFGKWHNGSQYPYHPSGRGFQEYYGFTSGHWGDYFSPPLDHNGKLVVGDGYITDDFTNKAMTFLEKHRESPFLCYLAMPTPHSPMQVPDQFYEPFAKAELKLRYTGKEKEDLGHTRAALAMCENIDWNVGRLLAKLDQLKLAENTIVLYFSDNGPNGWRWNENMRGRKGSTDEGGVRSPLLVRWPGHIKPGTTIHQIAGAIDLLPTLANLTGVPLEGGKPLDGINLAPLLTGTVKQWPDRMLFARWAGKVSVRTQRFRLDDAGRLYDLTADPGQKTDVTSEHPETSRKLKDAVAEFRKTVIGPIGKDDRPFPVGYAEFPVTWLPARDGIATGKIRRSAPAPNCSYYTNWTTTDDRITWDIDIHTAGRYQLEAFYTCPKSALGSTVEASFGDNRVTAKVTVENDPPLRGMENDRSDRGSESFVKDFQPMSLGVLELKPGRGLLTLRATDIPGSQVMDLRAVTMTLLK